MSVTDLSVGGGCGLCVEVVLCSCTCACRLQGCVQQFIQWFCLCLNNSCGWWVWSVCVGGLCVLVVLCSVCVCVHVGLFTVACGWGLCVCFHVHVVHRVVSMWMDMYTILFFKSRLALVK